MSLVSWEAVANASIRNVTTQERGFLRFAENTPPSALRRGDDHGFCGRKTYAVEVVARQIT